MAQSVAIRELVRSDISAYRELRARALLEHPEAFGESYDDFIARPLDQVAAVMASDSSFTFGALRDDSLVGITRCRRSVIPKESHKAFVTSVYVAPEARGLGLGRKLMTSVIEGAARWPEVEELRLAVVMDQSAARALYRSLGFVPYAVEPRAMRIAGKYVDEEHMYLLLGGARRV